MKQTHPGGPILAPAPHWLHEAIATRAYELWLRDGQRENKSEAYWLEAEVELVAGRRQPRNEPRRPLVLF